jgi:hypothetical protein
MSSLKGWIILGLVDLVLLYLLPKVGSVFFVLLFLKILSDINIFKRVNIGKAYFTGPEIYYKEYFGNYRNIGYTFNALKTELGLSSDDTIMGIYYDNPCEVDPDRCRAIVAVVNDKHYNYSDEKLNSHGLKKAKLPSCEALSEYFTIIAPVFIFIAMTKFYKAFANFVKDKESCKRYHFELPKDCLSIEVYKKNKITFYIPYKSDPGFYLHSTEASSVKKTN